MEFEVHWQPQALLVHVERFLERGRRRDVDDITAPMQTLAELATQCGIPPWPAEHTRPEIALLESDWYPAAAGLFAGSHHAPANAAQ